MKCHYFGTDGIRGTYGVDPITETFASRVAAGVVAYLRERAGGETRTLSVVMARDTRFSGPELSAAFAGVFALKGVKCIDLGVVPTPQVAFATRHFEADLGLAITASHNPVSDNGFKLFRGDGTKLEATEEAAIENQIRQQDAEPPPSLQDRSARLYGPTEHGAALNRSYAQHIARHFSSLRLDGMRIVVDAANGATWGTTPSVLESMGAEVHRIACEPDGHNINVGVGSEHPEGLRQTVLETGADLGIAHDGDGDRVLVVDADGELLSGEHFLAILARYSPTLACDATHPLVTTTMSNFALDAYLGLAGIPVIRTDVGDRNVAVAMRNQGCLLGGENSGHFICADVLGSGDGLVALLKLLEAVHPSERSLQGLRAELSLYPSRLLNLSVAEKRDFSQLPNLIQTVGQVEASIDGKGRVLLRYSGTENKIRILVECASQDQLASHLAALEEAARNDLEVLT